MKQPGLVACNDLIARLLGIERHVVEILLFRRGLKVNGLGRVCAARVKVEEDCQISYHINPDTELKRRWPEE